MFNFLIFFLRQSYFIALGLSGILVVIFGWLATWPWWVLLFPGFVAGWSITKFFNGRRTK